MVAPFRLAVPLATVKLVAAAVAEGNFLSAANMFRSACRDDI